MKTKNKKPITRAKMRVAIAKDVVKQIKAEMYDMNFPAYIGTNCTITKDSAQNLKCRTCAIGAAIVSGIRLFNKVQAKSGLYPIDAAQLIKTWFPLKQAALIELAFQGSIKGLSGGDVLKINKDVIPKAFQKAIDFYFKYPNNFDLDCAPKRALALFRNIIRNKGTFKP